MQFELPILQGRYETSDEGSGLLWFGELMVAMRLEFLGFIPKGAFYALTKLKFSSGLRALQVRKPFPSKIFNGGKERLQLLDALRQVIDRRCFRPRPIGFCTCHKMCAKCSPRPVDRQQNTRKSARRSCDRLQTALRRRRPENLLVRGPQSVLKLLTAELPPKPWPPREAAGFSRARDRTHIRN